ncbi:MAG: OmpA family protein [Pyrinomonadaceae bacterium]
MTRRNHQTGEGKVDYTFAQYWSPTLAPWERHAFPPQGTMGLIRFYNFDIASAALKHGHITGFAWLGEMALKESVRQNGDPVYVIGAHSNTGDRTFNLNLSRSRAESVARFLAGRGIPAEKMNVLAGRTLSRDSRGELERWRAVTVMFTAFKFSP